MKKAKDIKDTIELLPGESWKWVPEYEKLYKVSNFGRIKSYFGKRKSKETVLKKPYIINSGYFVVQLTKQPGEKKKKSLLIHRLVAELFIPNPKNKPCVNHINGIKTDNRVSNLEWVTRAENIKKAWDNGKMHNDKRKLNPKKVRNIRKLYATGNWTITALAKKYKITIPHCSGIIHSRIWVNVK